MAWVFLAAIIALPVIEIALFVKASQLMGVLPTILLAILAGLAGLALVKRQGLATAWRVRRQMETGELPVAEAFDALCLAVAGALLLLPGFLSDVVALLLLLPFVRMAIRAWLGLRLAAVVAGTRPGHSGSGHPVSGHPVSGHPVSGRPPPVIEGDCREIPPDK